MEIGNERREGFFFQRKLFPQEHERSPLEGEGNPQEDLKEPYIEKDDVFVPNRGVRSDLARWGETEG